MANIVYNELTISSSPSELAEIKRMLVGMIDGMDTALSLESIKPTPSRLVGYAREKWRIENWGTSRNVYAKLVVPSEGRLLYKFDSTHEQPTKAILTLSARFPNADFLLVAKDEFGETSTTEIKNGVVISESWKDCTEEEDCR